MERSHAVRAIENLRKGLPPSGFIEHFTVGREAELGELSTVLEGNDGAPVLLLKANYGAGKSHLLRFIREKALAQGYAVSLVTLDARSRIRFNRMDQILGEIFRCIELPREYGEPGLAGACGFVDKKCRDGVDNGEPFWENLSNRGRWDFSEELQSGALFVAIRAWIKGTKDQRDLVIDWLQNPEIYRNQRRQLHEKLVADLRTKFRDPRPDWQFYADNVFSVHTDGYRGAWDALSDMHTLLENCGLRGLVILFDEFEDVLTNIKNIAHQESAFWNLFLFFSGKRFSGKSFYAVTPAFSQKCKQRLLEKGRWDFDYQRFDLLPTFEMSPLGESELFELGNRILKTHMLAYGYSLSARKLPVILGRLQETVKRSVQSPVQDRARHTIREVVQYLDQGIQD